MTILALIAIHCIWHERVYDNENEPQKEETPCISKRWLVMDLCTICKIWMWSEWRLRFLTIQWVSLYQMYKVVKNGQWLKGPLHTQWNICYVLSYDRQSMTTPLIGRINIIIAIYICIYKLWTLISQIWPFSVQWFPFCFTYQFWVYNKFARFAWVLSTWNLN